jgi:hypothetical protein
LHAAGGVAAALGGRSFHVVSQSSKRRA